jgi:hypothetical protein
LNRGFAPLKTRSANLIKPSPTDCQAKASYAIGVFSDVPHSVFFLTVFAPARIRRLLVRFTLGATK